MSSFSPIGAELNSFRCRFNATRPYPGYTRIRIVVEFNRALPVDDIRTGTTFRLVSLRCRPQTRVPMSRVLVPCSTAVPNLFPMDFTRVGCLRATSVRRKPISFRIKADDFTPQRFIRSSLVVRPTVVVSSGVAIGVDAETVNNQKNK